MVVVVPDAHFGVYAHVQMPPGSMPMPMPMHMGFPPGMQMQGMQMQGFPPAGTSLPMPMHAGELEIQRVQGQ